MIMDLDNNVAKICMQNMYVSPPILIIIIEDYMQYYPSKRAPNFRKFHFMKDSVSYIAIACKAIALDLNDI